MTITAQNFKEFELFIRPGMGNEVIYWNLNSFSLNDVM